MSDSIHVTNKDKAEENLHIGDEEFFVAKYFGIKDKRMEEMLKDYHEYKSKSKLQAIKGEVEDIEKDFPTIGSYEEDSKMLQERWDALMEYIEKQLF